MKIKCIDGYIREFIPFVNSMSRAGRACDSDVRLFVGKPTYCDHCREPIGFVSPKSDECRNHICNKSYQYNNHKKLLSYA